jgi:hypothetical protein
MTAGEILIIFYITAFVIMGMIVYLASWVDGIEHKMSQAEQIAQDAQNRVDEVESRLRLMERDYRALKKELGFK